MAFFFCPRLVFGLVEGAKLTDPVALRQQLALGEYVKKG